MKSLEEQIKELPPELQKEIEDFVQFLLEKSYSRVQRRPKLAWRGALRDLRDRYTSVELQHKAREWWGN